MQAFPQGLIKTVTAGTRVAFPALTANNGQISRIMVSQAVGMTGAVSIGDATVVHSTKVGVARQFTVPAATGQLDDFELVNTYDANTVDPTKYYIDSAVNAEGVVVVYYQN